ncbi:MAG: glycosyltransferase family 2 protein [Phycisphaera sp. RhM]|nr:glycosyltransferase family 2 protein [Phycisphaera sp. RhM]
MSSSVASRPSEATTSIELSVVMPCLNEADTVGTCVEKAVRAMKEAGIVGEVVVADNGSTDGSQELAIEQGARIVDVPQRGYGAALMHGIEASRGKYVLMGDADDSYDFLEIPKFIDSLRQGHDLVQGCRLPRGGGRVLPGAMPFLHRWFGNPVLSWLVRLMFRIPINDIYCGMRGFTRKHYDQLDLRSPGMEFATEMIIKSGLHRDSHGTSWSQVPITLHPDGRQAHPPHLRTFRDGWRTLRLFLAFSPTWTFFRPGLVLLMIGLVGYALALPQVKVFGAALDVHTLLVASLFVLMGWQCVLLATLARIFTGREGMMPPHEKLEHVTVERGLAFGIAAGIGGVAMIGFVVWRWWQQDFGALDYPFTMRWVVPGVTLVAIGFQTAMASLMSGVLMMQRSRRLDRPIAGSDNDHQTPTASQQETLS